MIQSFLMIGQSNMAGRGFLHEVPPIYNEKIQMLRNGRWQMMTEPINYDRPVAGISLAGSFAEAWCQKHPDETIGLIPCAEGGSTLDDWSIDGALFKHALSEAAFALKNSELAGILWHQGESDSSNSSYQTYYERLLVIVNELRKELNAPEIPLIIGELGGYLGKSGFGSFSTEYSEINQELKRFAMEQKNCWFVTAEGLTANPDGIHIDAASLRRFGLRYFEAFNQKTDVLTPLANEKALLEQLYQRDYTPTEQIYLASLALTTGKITYRDFEAQMAEITNKNSQ